jgi:hypothetical protein
MIKGLAMGFSSLFKVCPYAPITIALNGTTPFRRCTSVFRNLCAREARHSGLPCHGSQRRRGHGSKSNVN